MWVRTAAGSMVDIDKAWRLHVEVLPPAKSGTGADLYQMQADFLEADSVIVKGFTSRENADAFLNQIAARANGANVLPIDTDSPRALRRNLRFGEPEVRR